MLRLGQRGIETRTFFIPMHEQPLLQRLGLATSETYPVATALGRRGVYLPSSTGLTEEEIRYVVAAVREIQAEARQ